jgi:cytochrome c oxidase accessory protein FixG
MNSKSKVSEFELHPERLGTADAEGKRIFLFPADVSGFFRRWRTRVQFVLIVFFLVLPWIRIHGRQALLLNLADRQFEIFGLSLRAHNAPLLILVLAAAAFGLFFVTAVFGRIWCGWACPQTVFIDGVFRKIERWTEGPALERRKLDRGPWTIEKVRKRSAKWSLFLLTSLVLTHSFLAYFVGTEKLATMVRHSPTENPGDFLFMLIATAVILFDFAWFREQFCTIVCPYGRLQSVLMDKTSLVVAYDVERGEPRATPQAKAILKTHGGKLGDCVNCYRCVQVCPTGIDIRRGLQMECIACTSCMDACDEVMTKLKRPTGLIKYDSIEPRTVKTTNVNLRAMLYLTLCLASVGALILLLGSLKPIDVEVLRATDAPYTVQTAPDGTTIIVNHLRLQLSNQSGTVRSLKFGTLKPAFDLITATQPYFLPKDEVRRVDIFIRFPKALLTGGQTTLKIFVRDISNENESAPIYVEKEVTLVGPFS